MKIGVCAGHGNGSNVIPMPYRTIKKEYNYSEGTTMHQLALEICKAYPQIYNARPETGNPSWFTRAKRLKAAGCETVMELHTNWSVNSVGKPNRGVFLVITSLCYEDGANRVKRAAEEKAMATRLFKPLADSMGLRFEIRTRKGGGNWDYYSFINDCRKRGIPHAFIVEHGYHMDFADDVAGNIKKVVARYGKIIAMLNPPAPKPSVVEYVFKKGDTLWSIAIEHGFAGKDWVLITRKDKKPIDPENMHVGDVLLIPVKK